MTALTRIDANESGLAGHLQMESGNRGDRALAERFANQRVQIQNLRLEGGVTKVLHRVAQSTVHRRYEFFDAFEVALCAVVFFRQDHAQIVSDRLDCSKRFGHFMGQSGKNAGQVSVGRCRLIELNEEGGRGFSHVWQHTRIAPTRTPA